MKSADKDAKVAAARSTAADLELRAAALGAPIGEGLAARTPPMLCERSNPGDALATPGWLYELKLDGVRILSDVQSSGVKLFYRKSRDTTVSYPEVAAALASLASSSGATRLVLDGEIVTFDAHGRPSFERLGQRFSLTRPEDVKTAMRAVPVVYVVFDLLAVGARDLRPLALIKRKELLRALIPDELRDVLRVLDYFRDDGGPLFELCKREKLEGIVAKRGDSPYRAGTRSSDWRKVKCEQDEDFVVVAWTRDTAGGLGALDLATYDGDVLRVRGEAGSGIDRKTAARLLARFEGLKVSGPTAVGEYEVGEDRTHLAPEMVVRVRWLSWSESGRLRFPVFLGVREDIEPRDCHAAPEAAKPLEGATPPAAAVGDDEMREAARVATAKRGAANDALTAYYEAAASLLVRYAAGRPLAVARAAADERSPLWTLPSFAVARVVALPAAARARQAMVIDDEAALLALVAAGARAFFVAGAREASLDRADWLALDLDARNAPPKIAAKIALATRGVLAELGLPAFAVTAATDGVHVLAPTGGVPWEAVRAFSELVARAVVHRAPRHATVDPSVAKAGGRVLLLASPSLPFAPLVAPYSVRVHPGAEGLVAAPLAWDEVSRGAPPARFTVASMRARLEDDPLRGLEDGAKVDFAAAARRVAELFA